MAVRALIGTILAHPSMHDLAAVLARPVANEFDHPARRGGGFGIAQICLRPMNGQMAVEWQPDCERPLRRFNELDCFQAVDVVARTGIYFKLLLTRVVIIKIGIIH